MPDGNYTSVSISDLIINRVDKLFIKAGFTNRASYIQQKLRDAIEKDEKRYGGEDATDRRTTT
jgi:metal-responsive CopG/Arc/MetJ family transcriptional regulator